MLFLTLAAGIGVFFLLPLVIATFTTSQIDNGFVQHLVEGLVRVAIFLGYLVLIAQAKDIRRVFQYHGAEHMTIHAWEAGDALTTAEVRKYPTAHQRCGTEFLVVVIALSILLFSLVGRQTPVVMVVSRILLIPVIAALGYELLRLGARHRGQPGRQGDHDARDLGPEDHHPPADRRHDRGRDRVDGAGARRRR